ncbi:MAG: hypothetical protein GY754_21195 [bacterium]|nr:hypothetical protein [bacterium]
MRLIIITTTSLLFTCFIGIVIIGAPQAASASTIEVEADSVLRSYSGDVESARYNLLAGVVVQQDMLFGYSNKGLGRLLTGLDFHYFIMENENASMLFFQLGAVGSFYFDNLYGRPGTVPYPLIRLHGGINFTSLSSGASNIDTGAGMNAFAGIGAGFGMKLISGLHFRSLYFFDTHFFKDGFLLIHSFTMGLAYRF